MKLRDAIHKAAVASGDLAYGELQLWYEKKLGGDAFILDSIDYSTYLRQLAQGIRKDNGNVNFSLLPATQWELSPGHTDDEQENVLQWKRNKKTQRLPPTDSTVLDFPRVETRSLQTGQV